MLFQETLRTGTPCLQRGQPVSWHQHPAASPERRAVGPQWLETGVLPRVKCTHSAQGGGGPRWGGPGDTAGRPAQEQAGGCTLQTPLFPMSPRPHTRAAAWGLPFGMYFKKYLY